MLVKNEYYLFLQALAVVGIYLLVVYVIAWKTKFLGSKKAKMLRYGKT